MKIIIFEIKDVQLDETKRLWGIVVNRVFPSLHGGLLQIKRIVPLSKHAYKESQIISINNSLIRWKAVESKSSRSVE